MNSPTDLPFFPFPSQLIPETPSPKHLNQKPPKPKPSQIFLMTEQLHNNKLNKRLGKYYRQLGDNDMQFKETKQKDTEIVENMVKLKWK